MHTHATPTAPLRPVVIHLGQRNQWNAFVASNPYGHVLQSWEWGELKADSGWEPIRLALMDGTQMRAAAQVLIRRTMPFGFGKVAYVPKGPVLDYENRPLLHATIGALSQVASRYRVLSLKIEPEVIEPCVLGVELAALRLVPAPPVQMRTTIWVDLTPEEDQILARQHHKTRYNIRLAARRGVEVSCGEIDDLDMWYDMYRVTAARDGFSIHGRDYYRRVLDILGRAGSARLLLARHEGDLLAGIIVFSFGEKAYYMYGASSNQKRNLMAPYLVQWEAMRWARSRGARVYDLWGIPDILSEDQDLWGVYRHKRGYGGEIVRYCGAFDLVRARWQHAALEGIARPALKKVARRAVQQAE